MSKPDLTTYGGRLRDIGYAGQVVDSSTSTIENRTNSGAISIDFGRAVARGADAGSVKAPTADGDKIIGISVRHATMVADGSGNVAYQQYVSVPFMREGNIYAIPAENVTEGDPVLSLTAGNGTLGGTTGGAAGAGRVAVPAATWETTTAAGAVGKIRLAG